MELNKYYVAFTLICFVNVSEAVRSAKNSELAMAFEKARIVPDIIKEAPANKLKVTWETASAELGNTVCPLRTVLPGCLQFNTVAGKYYTIVFIATLNTLIDADLPSRAAPVHRSYLLRLDVNAPASNLDGGFTVAPRVPPTPAPGSGMHRCVVLAYQQPGHFDTYDANLIQYGVSRIQFNISQFGSRYNLGTAVAGNFFFTVAPNDYEKQCCRASTTCSNKSS